MFNPPPAHGIPDSPDCARPTGSVGQATRRAEADPALTLNSDHRVGAGHERGSHYPGPRLVTEVERPAHEPRAERS